MSSRASGRRRWGRGELTCSRCIELFEAVEQAIAGDRTFEALRCDEVRCMTVELGHRSSPSVAQLTVARLHVATCGDCAKHILAARLTADSEPATPSERDTRFDNGQISGDS
jgi:hypothetical protein